VVGHLEGLTLDQLTKAGEDSPTEDEVGTTQRLLGTRKRRRGEINIEIYEHN